MEPVQHPAGIDLVAEVPGLGLEHPDEPGSVELTPLEAGPGVGVGVGGVDRADRVGREPDLGLVGVERLERARQDHPTEVEQHGAKHLGSVRPWLTDLMPRGHAVVDGSNIATEGRTEPSLKQLREAISAFREEYSFRNVTVIVDASFEHRVAKSEQRAVRRAIDDGEIITPPAGVIGRGDAFILQVADKATAVVLSNDSFQEFHGTYPWLFDEGRLIGGKPVPGVGWIYVDRTPVRGVVSRRATAKKAAKKSAATTTAKKSPAKAARRAPAPEPPPAAPHAGRNEQKAWRRFRRNHPVGSSVRATVDRFSSHGAYAHAGEMIVYLPNQLLGDPAPSKARDVVEVGDTREFVVHRYEEEHHGIDAGLIPTPDAPTPARTGERKAAEKPPAKKAPAKKGPAKKGPAKKTAAKRTAKKTPARTAKKTPAAKANRTTRKRRRG